VQGDESGIVAGEVRRGIVVPEKTEEEGETVACPARAIDNLNKDSMGIILIRLHNRQRNNQSQCRSNIKNRIELNQPVASKGVRYRSNSGKPGCIKGIQYSVE